MFCRQSSGSRFVSAFTVCCLGIRMYANFRYFLGSNCSHSFLYSQHLLTHFGLHNEENRYSREADVQAEKKIHK